MSHAVPATEETQHSEETKKRCHIKAIRHALTGQFYAMSREDKIAFDIHCDSLIADFHPETYREKILAMSIAEGTWRLSRARALENNVFAIGMSGDIGDATIGGSPEVHAAACQARIWLRDGKELALLTTYESRIRRNIESDRKELAEIQATRHVVCNKALEEEKLLARLAIMEGREFHAGEGAGANGFGFSNGEITRIVRREMRLEKAARLMHQPAVNQPATPLRKPQAA